MGKSKVSGSGRKAGTPNKRTVLLQEILDEKGLDPIQGIVDSLAALDGIVCDHPDEEISIHLGKAKIYMDLLAYLFPKRKSIEVIQKDTQLERKIKTFEEFCVDAGYPMPYPKQVEMMQFGMNENVIRLLLGSRGYGKTDYVTIMGIAYQIYLDPTDTNLILTKSQGRNTSMLYEIANSLEKNGIELEKRCATDIRVRGLLGKDSSASALTMRSVSLRGRHPNRIIMDDPVTPDDTTEASRRFAKIAYNEAVKLTDNVILIGQPVHKYDLFEEVRQIVKKMEVPYGSIPELDPDLEAQRLAGVDEASIQASYYLKISSEGTTPFDKVKYIDAFPYGTSVAFMDPSDGGNDTAVSIFRRSMEGMAVVGFTWKKSWHHCLDDLLPLLTKYQVEKLCFETNKHGQQPLDALRTVFPRVGIVGRNSNSNKHSRIMAAGAYSHMIFLSKESTKNYIEQVVKYEYGAKIDDAPDSLATGLEWIGMIRGKR